MHHAELLDGLCRTLHIDSLEPDADGVYAIVFDRGLDIEIVPLSDRQILLRSSLSHLPEDEDEREEFFRSRLQRNLLMLREQTASLSFDPDSQRLWLHRVVESNRIDLPGFLTAVEDFVNTLEWWQSFESASQRDAEYRMEMPYTMLRP